MQQQKVQSFIHSASIYSATIMDSTLCRKQKMTETHYLGQERQDSPHTYQNSQNPEHRQHQMLMRMWSNRNSHTLLERMQNGTATVEDSFQRKQFLTKLNILLPYDPVIMQLGIYPKKLKTYIHTKSAHGYLQQLYSQLPTLGSNQDILQQVNG